MHPGGQVSETYLISMRQVLDVQIKGCSGARAFLAALLTPRVLQKSMFKVLLELQQLSNLALTAPDSCHPQLTRALLSQKPMWVLVKDNLKKET